MAFFCHNKWVAKRQGHRNLEFHIVHLLEPAPQTQTATAHLQTTCTVYFDGQGTQKLPCGKIPPPPHPPRGWGWRGGRGYGLAHGLLAGQVQFPKHESAGTEWNQLLNLTYAVFSPKTKVLRESMGSGRPSQATDKLPSELQS